MQLETREQALAYLAQIQPSVTFEVQPFESGWICKQNLPPQENLGRGLGMASLIIDKETGVVTVQSSLPRDLIAQQYAEAKRTGEPLPGRQIYPHQWRITIRRIREDRQRIEYQMAAESLTDPPEPTQQHPLTIDKQTYLHDPTDWLSSVAMSHAEWMSRQNQGAWPEVDTTEV
ncbi:hypothetical protein MLIT_27960 [Mycolicibacterium litorale]|uniref:Uncharacterized protein n=2 Tax=Mycolicibacterium litorale TaxID=758802 RepID=A0AAD1MSF4_9MYCO|nr:hypothetical protein BCL50_1351 [Mycolicibacterium litorale]BBY17204.1 hypothetical protein MLIT_27960 [Mycolicibacterium litorale]